MFSHLRAFFSNSFWQGFGNILNLFPEPTSKPSFLDKTPEELLAKDWKKVGDNMRAAMKIIDRELERKNNEKYDVKPEKTDCPE